MSVQSPPRLELSKKDAARLSALAAEIRKEVTAMERAAQTIVEHAINIGEALLTAKGIVPGGQWQRWLAVNFGGTEPTASKYMRLARYRDEVAGARSIEQAVAMIPATVDSPPPPVTTDPGRGFRLTSMAVTRALTYAEGYRPDGSEATAAVAGLMRRLEHLVEIVQAWGE